MGSVYIPFLLIKNNNNNNNNNNMGFQKYLP